MGNGPDSAAPGQESSAQLSLIRLSKYLSRALAVSSLILLLPASTAAAMPSPAQTAAGSGLALTPAIQDQVLSPKQSSVSFPVQLYNHTSQPVTLSLSTVDFTSLNQTGGIAFEGGAVAGQASPHGLSSFLKLSSQTVTLVPDAAQTITASINDVSKLAVGGHYGAVLAQTVSPPSDGNSNHVAIKQVLSSLIFLETAGQGTKIIKLLPPPVSRLSFSLPDSLNLVFDSTGNTQAIPRGTVSISHGDTSKLQGIINENSALILPDSARLFQTQLHGNRHPFWPGRYQLEIQYRYEGSLGITTYQQSFLYINISTLLLAILTLIVIVSGVLKLRRKTHLQQRLQAFNKRTAAALPLPTLPPEPPQPIATGVVKIIPETPAEMPVMAPADDSVVEPLDDQAADVSLPPAGAPELPAKSPLKITVAEAPDPEPEVEHKLQLKPKPLKNPGSTKKPH